MILLKKIAVLVLCAFFFSNTSGQVRTGLDNLIQGSYAQFGKDLRIGLICNETSRTYKGEFAAKLFAHNELFKLVALFAPEHGLFGTRKAGMKSDVVEKYEGIPVYSLYGATRKPTKKMLKGIDALVFDIQDIGVRPYTYLSTMIYAMEAAAENDVQFIVLDRPNPLSGERIEGNILDPSLCSFVGALPIPYLHGMTLGELAQMAKEEKWFAHAEDLDLTVIKMTGWYRSMYWNETGLKWTAPSPNIPTFESAVGCAMLGAIGELGILSVGIGSDLPFLRIGSKLVHPDVLEQAVFSSLPKEVPAQSEDYTVPFEDSSKTFYGVKIMPPKNMKDVENLYGPEFVLFQKLLADSVFLRSYQGLPFSTQRMFEKVTGTSQLLKAFETKADINSILANWKKDDARFRSMRRKYLLYQ
ncbi:MAG: DUF1343 domain-containing protein [Candidatus Kapaibacterium sp.]